jgi:hypothetical protein
MPPVVQSENQPSQESSVSIEELQQRIANLEVG